MKTKKSKSLQNAIEVQINGEVRGNIMVPPEADEVAVLATVLGDRNIAEILGGKTLVKSIYIPGRLINLIVR